LVSWLLNNADLTGLATWLMSISAFAFDVTLHLTMEIQMNLHVNIETVVSAAAAGGLKGR